MSDLSKFFKSLKRSESSRRGGMRAAERTNVLQDPVLKPFTKEQRRGLPTKSAEKRDLNELRLS